MNDQRFFIFTRPDGIRTYLRVDAVDKATVAADKLILVCGADVIEVHDLSEATAIVAALDEMLVKSS